MAHLAEAVWRWLRGPVGLATGYLILSIFFVLPTRSTSEPAVAILKQVDHTDQYEPDLRLFDVIKTGDATWLSAAFIAFKSSLLPLPQFMESKYGVECECVEGEVDRECLERCLKRHVALFYTDYVSASANPSPRPFAIPQCDYLGIGFEPDGRKLEGDLGGSQSRVFLRHLHGRPYLVKTFNDKEDKARKPFEPRRGLNRLMMMSEMGDNRRRNDKGAYYRETGAFNVLPSNSPFFIHPVCFWDDHRAILYPYFGAGDLVPNDNDDAIIDKLDASVFKKIARELIEAVHQMHTAGIAHMDLKPENILIGGRPASSRAAYLSPSPTVTTGPRTTLKIIDFGLCIKTADFPGLGCLKAGTKVTMSPEQLLCHRPISPAADWWGVGATLYRLRVMWDPLLDDPEDSDGGEERRNELLNLRDHHWQHTVMQRVEEFGAEWNQFIGELLQLYPEFRQFDKNMDRLWRLPYFNS